MVSRLSKYEKIGIIGADLILAAITTPIELSMLPPELHVPFISFKLWMFVAVPIIFLVFLGREKNAPNDNRSSSIDSLTLRSS